MHLQSKVNKIFAVREHRLSLFEGIRSTSLGEFLRLGNVIVNMLSTGFGLTDLYVDFLGICESTVASELLLHGKDQWVAVAAWIQLHLLQ